MNNKRFFFWLLIVLLLFGCGKKNEVKETKIVKYCEAGELEEDKCKIVNSVDPVSITCEDDFEFNEETRKCENTISIPANRRIGCKDEENYELKNGACYPKSGKGATKYRINIYTCPDSGTLIDNMCEFVDEQDAVVVCPEGYEVNKNKAICEAIIYEDVKTRQE